MYLLVYVQSSFRFLEHFDYSNKDKQEKKRILDDKDCKLVK